MSDEHFRHHFQVTQRQIAALQRFRAREDAEAWEEIDAALYDLHMVYEEMQTSLEAAEVVEEELLQQHQRVTAGYHHYYDLFQASPIAYLVTDANGLILKANSAFAQLLNVPQPYLAGKPLVVYVAEGDRRAFRNNLNQLSQTSQVQHWQMTLCPRKNEPFIAELNVAIARNLSGFIESLRIGVYNMSQFKHWAAQLTQRQNIEEIRAEVTMPSLPQSFDGLQVDRS